MTWKSLAIQKSFYHFHVITWEVPCKMRSQSTQRRNKKKQLHQKWWESSHHKLDSLANICNRESCSSCGSLDCEWLRPIFNLKMMGELHGNSMETPLLIMVFPYISPTTHGGIPHFNRNPCHGLKLEYTSILGDGHTIMHRQLQWPK